MKNTDVNFYSSDIDKIFSSIYKMKVDFILSEYKEPNLLIIHVKHRHRLTEEILKNYCPAKDGNIFLFGMKLIFSTDIKEEEISCAYDPKLNNL